MKVNWVSLLTGSMKYKVSFFLLALIVLQFKLVAQTPPSTELLLQQARNLEKSIQYEQSIQKYEEYLKFSPANITVLCKLSEIYSIAGRELNEKKKQTNYFQRAKNLATQALKLQPSYADANFVMSLAQGNLALVTFGKDKIDAVLQVKNYAEKTVMLDPNSYKGYHVLGKWYFEISNLNAIEKWLVKMTFGALPEASFQKAANCFEKSRLLNPGFLLNYLELAKCYTQMEQKSKALECILTLEKLPANTKEEQLAKKQAAQIRKDF